MKPRVAICRHSAWSHLRLSPVYECEKAKNARQIVRRRTDKALSLFDWVKFDWVVKMELGWGRVGLELGRHGGEEGWGRVGK